MPRAHFWTRASGPRSGVATAVCEIAATLGWECVAALPGRWSSRMRPPSVIVDEGVLLLIRRRDRRLLVADTRPSRRTRPPDGGGDVTDAFRSLEWFSESDERASANQSPGPAVPRVDVVRWGPDDLLDGAVERHLR